MEKITMADVVYVPVDARTGEPTRWGLEGEVCVSVFGNFWRCRRSPEAKGKRIMALAIDDLQEVMGGAGKDEGPSSSGAWADLTHVAYHPAGDLYQLGREAVMEEYGGEE